MIPRIMLKISNIIKPFRWLVFSCLILFGFLAYYFLPRAPEGGSIDYTELPHILIMLGVFWSVSLFFILVFCRGVPVKPEQHLGFITKARYFLKLTFTWYISIFMALYLCGLIFGTTSYLIKSVSGS
jgi:hypothetical protein